MTNAYADFSTFYAYQNGHWIWDNYIEGINFLSFDERPAEVVSSIFVQPADANQVKALIEVKFKDDVGLLSKIKFRRNFQRKFPIETADIITLQDIKDVVLYTAQKSNLTIEFVELLHTLTIDRYFRALIIYFQYYILVWNKLVARREEKKRKIYHPYVTIMENRVSEDLADLRAMVAKEYCSFLFGAKELKKFHHMSKQGTSCLDKDKRLFELLKEFSVRIIWIALKRPNKKIIELELNRLLRSDSFNIYKHQKFVGSEMDVCKDEDRVLRGLADVSEPRLIQRSPLGKELFVGKHDHRILAINQVTFSPIDERYIWFQAAYSAPEEKLEEYDIQIGILGQSKTYFDEMLQEKYKGETENNKKDDIPATHLELPIPLKFLHSDAKIPSTFPTRPPIFVISAEYQKSIHHQCKLWIDTLKKSKTLLFNDNVTQDITLYSFDTSN